MLGLARRDSRTRHVPGVGAPAAEHGYVTDGLRLFRVVAPLAPDLGVESAVLEDCATLSWRAYSAGELWWLRLRQVTPGDAGAAL